MSQLHILTLPFHDGEDLFDLAPVRLLLRDHKLLQHSAHFFLHEGRPFWTLCLTTRPLTHAERAQPPSPTPHAPRPDPAPITAHDPAPPLDEHQRALFEKLRRWRAGEARKIAQPPYTVLTNDTLRLLVLARPATLAALSQVQGIGPKRLQQHGDTLLELLHATDSPSGAQPPPPLRALDGHDPLAPPEDPPLAQAPAPDPDTARRGDLP